MTVYMENSKEVYLMPSTPELKSKYNKVTRHRHKVSMLSYIPVMKNWNLKLKKIPFVIAPKTKLRYLCNKICTGLYVENYKTLMKEVKLDLNKWKNILSSWVKRHYC